MNDETENEGVEEIIEETVEAPEVDPVAQAKREAAAAKREATKMRKQLEELQAAEEARRQAELTEVERERERAEALAQEIEQMKILQARKEKASWIREAARDARIDADVAAALITDDTLESPADAKAALEALASEKPHLVLPESGQRVGTHAGEPPKVADDPETGMANFLLGLMGRR